MRPCAEKPSHGFAAGWRGSGSLPLSGVRVLDFGQYVAGPMAATLLADAGATVTTVTCPQCKEPKRPHFVCAFCGYYDGRQVITPKDDHAGHSHG